MASSFGHQPQTNTAQEALGISILNIISEILDLLQK